MRAVGPGARRDRADPMHAGTWLASVLVAAAGCFNPDPPAGRPCGPDGWCPSPLTCMANVCGGGGGPDDDARIDVDTSGPHNRAFVSDPIVVGGKTVSDLDAHCKTGAPPGNYVAWFSSGTASASSRLGDKYGWVRTDGKPFANRLTDLVGGAIYYPLRVDKNGDEVLGQVYVATATLPNGTWTGTACPSTGPGPLSAGVADGTSGAWTDYEYANLNCASSARVYCLQVDHANDIAAPTATGKIVFITKQAMMGNMGLAAMDARCTMEAGVPARAIVATPAEPAKAKLPVGVQLVRPDGVVAFDATLKQLAPINVTIDKQYIDSEAWAGAIALDAVPGNETCDGWFDPDGTGLGRTGRSSRSLEEWFGSIQLHGCSGSYPIRCVTL
ncbi:MAG TPA: hypothetical protein VIV11_27585 [Kofleriaceae bacterium]